MCHDLLIFAETKPALSPRLAALSGANRVVACPGATWCTRGLVDSRAAACRIRRALPGGCELLVGVTGCPNNCSQAATADIGLIGRLLRRNGQEHVEGFRLFAGGGKGETPALAEELHPGLPAKRSTKPWLGSPRSISKPRMIMQCLLRISWPLLGKSVPMKDFHPDDTIPGTPASDVTHI